MNREYHKWYSPSLNRDMELLVFGHAGARVLVFPTSKGKYYEWEDRGMMATLGSSIDNGWLQLFCVDSVDAESWYAYWAHPGGRAYRHAQYDGYLYTEVLPFTRSKNGNPFLISTGASFGAYHAVNFAFRHPETVGRVLGMSGLYDIRQFMDGHYDQEFYFNNPIDFLGGEHDPERLAALQRMDIILAIGHDDPSRPSNQHLSGILWGKGVWHALRLWDGWAHDWPYWEKMLTLYIGGHD